MATKKAWTQRELPGLGLLTQDQVAEYVGCQPAALRAWRTRGGGPAFIRVGTLVRYDPADVKEWLASRRVTGP